MNCKHCNEPMTEYLGFNMSSSGQYDCLNKNCNAEKPTISDELCGGDLVIFNHLFGDWVSCDDCGKVYSGPEGAASDWQCTIPTQNVQAQPAQATQANSGTVHSRHNTQSQQVTPFVGVDRTKQLAPTRDLDDSDQCTLQQQASHQPRKLGTPMISPASLQCIRFEMELLEKGDVCEVCTPDGTEYRIVRLE